MRSDQLQRALEERLPRRHSVPWRSSGGMRQRNQIKPMARKVDGSLPPNDLMKAVHRNELRNRELSHRNYEPWTKDRHFLPKPTGAVRDFFFRRHPVATARILAGKTAAHCCHVNARSKFPLRNAACLLKPAEQCFACRPGKWPIEQRFFVSRRLPDQNDFACNRSSRHHRFPHPCASIAAQQFRHVTGQEDSRCRLCSHSSNRPFGKPIEKPAANLRTRREQLRPAAFLAVREACFSRWPKIIFWPRSVAPSLAIESPRARHLKLATYARAGSRSLLD